MYVYLHSNIRGGLRKLMYFETEYVLAITPSKVVGFGINWKRVCDFLLVINSNFDFGPI